MSDSLLGNECVGQYLDRLVKRKKFAGSFLFSGPDGVGKSLFALELAKKVFSLDDPEGKYLPKVAAGSHPDIFIYRPEGKTAMHSIESIRSLSEEVYLAPFEAKWKIYIIHEADRMLPYSANALLKTYEEPAPHAIMILLTSSPEKILPTIVSRCRKVHFQPVAEEVIASWLMAKQGIGQEEARRIAFLSKGSFSQAISHLCKGSTAVRETVLHFLSQDRSATYPDIRNFCKGLSEHFEKNKEEDDEDLSPIQKAITEKALLGETALSSQRELSFLFTTILSWFRDLHLILSNGNLKLLMNPDYEEAIINSVQKGNIRSLEEVAKAISAAELASLRFLPISSVLETLFVRLH